MGKEVKKPDHVRTLQTRVRSLDCTFTVAGQNHSHLNFKKTTLTSGREQGRKDSRNMK